MSLQETLDDKLYQKQARDTGICPLREELHSQAFDELVRQVTVEQEERGLILLRVRDQIRMSIAAYQTLYRTSVAFGVRKTLQAEEATAALDFKMKTLQQDKEQREVTIVELQNRLKGLEKQHKEAKELVGAKRRAEITFLEKQRDILQGFMSKDGA
jgi:dynein light intermediate chain